MKPGSSVHVQLPSELGFEKVAMNTAASMAELMGFSKERIDDLKTAVAEACINAMEHGNEFKDSVTSVSCSPVRMMSSKSRSSTMALGPGPSRPLPT